MFDVFSSSYIGVDIGTTSIKAVEIRKKGSGYELVNYGILETFGYLRRLNDAIQTSSLKIVVPQAAGLLKTLLNKAKFKTRNAAISIPSFSSFSTLIEIPEMPPEESLKALSFQIPRYLPLPVNEITIDWFKVAERQDEKGLIMQQFFTIAVTNDLIAKYKAIFKSAGLELKFLEVETVSVSRIFRDINQPVTIVDIGSQSTNIVIAKEGKAHYSRQIDFAGATLTQAIAKGLNIDVKRAEELKKQRGITVQAREYELSTLLLPFIDAIISETKRTEDDYKRDIGEKTEEVFLVGGGANMAGIGSYFEKQLNKKTTVGDPLKNISYPPKIELIKKELGPLLAVSVGLLLK